MKYAFLHFICVALPGFLNAQQHQLSIPFTYSNVTRNVHNKPVAQKTIMVQLTILKSSAAGAMVYQETHITPTNYFGAFNVTIGNGTPTNGTFANIDWSAGNYYLKVGIDTNATSHFVIIDQQQLLHPPYWLYAKSAGLKGDDNGTLPGFKHYIGEVYKGGVIFSLWKDATGNEHGLLVALADQSDSVPWSNIETKAIGVSAQSFWNGTANTAAITKQNGQLKSAASLCRVYAGAGYHDWYLPSAEELNLLYRNQVKINMALKKAGRPMDDNIYWSSTEAYDASAWGFAVYGGVTNNYVYSKYSALYVRAIRAF